MLSFHFKSFLKKKQFIIIGASTFILLQFDDIPGSESGFSNIILKIDKVLKSPSFISGILV